MIKKLSEALIEFELHRKVNEGESEDSRSFEEKFAEFKEFLASKGSLGPDPDVGVSVEKSYEAGKGEFGNMDKMIDLIVKYLNKHGIINPYSQRAILSTIGKESGFVPTRESSYKTTSPDRIRKIFGSRFAGLSDEEINRIKKDDAAFWDKVYGGKYGRENLGNTQPGDSLKYLGRGFNGITGRRNYQKFTDMLKKAGTNVDLISNPEILEKNPHVAAEVNALYFILGLSDPTIKRKYGNKDPNDFKDFQTALKAAVNSNAGPGLDITKGFGKSTYDSAVSVNNRLGTKFERAISGQRTKSPW